MYKLDTSLPEHQVPQSSVMSILKLDWAKTKARTPRLEPVPEWMVSREE